jgi:hypothetical protein
MVALVIDKLSLQRTGSYKNITVLRQKIIFFPILWGGWGGVLDIFFYRFVMVVRKNVLEYIIALVVVKNKVRLKKCSKFFQI